MFEFRLHLSRTADGSFRLAFGRIQRILFYIIVGLLLLGMYGSSEIPVLAVVLCLASLFGATFEDAWHWDAGKRRLSHRLGLVFLARTRSWDAEAIQGVELRHFTRGRFPGGPASPQDTAPGRRASIFFPRMIALVVQTPGGALSVETHRRREHDDLVQAAQLLAQACQVNLQESSDS